MRREALPDSDAAMLEKLEADLTAFNNRLDAEDEAAHAKFRERVKGIREDNRRRLSAMGVPLDED